MSQAAPEKNQHARRNCPAIPAAAAIATTVRRPARIIPHASSTNSGAWNGAGTPAQLAQQITPGRGHR